MKLYVASKFHNYEEARKVIDLLIAAGHEITHDWTRNEEFNLKTGKPMMYNGEAPLDIQKRVAYADILGVRRAERFIMLGAPEMKGSFVELGMAIGIGLPIDVIRPHHCYTLFYIIEQVTVYKDLDEMLAWYGVETG